jgi:hypothetical protein
MDGQVSSFLGRCFLSMPMDRQLENLFCKGPVARRQVPCKAARGRERGG